MKVLLEGYFFGISKKSDFTSKKTGEIYSDYPTVQFLVLTPTDFIGERAELVNITLAGNPDDSVVSNYYQKTKDLIGKFCTLSVNQERYKKNGSEVVIYNTTLFPKKFSEEKLDSKLSSVVSGSQLTPGQKLAAGL